MKTVPAGMVNVNVDYTGASGNTGPFVNAALANVMVSAFSMGETEVTYQLWEAVYDWATDTARGPNVYTFANPGQQGGGSGPVTAQHPVTGISWRDAVVWCNAYSEAAGRTPMYYYGEAVLRESEGNTVAAGDGKADQAGINPGNGYHLPSSAQWEYAARGGVPDTNPPWTYIYAGSNTVGDVAWYTTNSGSTTHPVKTKDANILGLYDMSGNVLEWCWDLHSGVSRVFRGGCWDRDASGCAVSIWADFIPYARNPNLGFRVVCP
jgi:formylglycine-generating enzyme required for sulfatase activity